MTKRKKHPYKKLKYYNFYILEHIISIVEMLKVNSLFYNDH